MWKRRQILENQSFLVNMYGYYCNKESMPTAGPYPSVSKKRFLAINPKSKIGLFHSWPPFSVYSSVLVILNTENQVKRTYQRRWHTAILHVSCILLLEWSTTSQRLWVYRISVPYAQKDPRFLFEKRGGQPREFWSLVSTIDGSTLPQVGVEELLCGTPSTW